MTLSAAFAAGLVFAMFGGFRLPAYATVCIAGMLAALWLGQRTAPLRKIPEDRLWDAGVFTIAAAFVLSRLLGLLLFLALGRGHLTLSLREVLAFSSVSYLSLTATCIFVALWLRWKQIPLLRAADAWAPCGALLWTAMALAGFASGERTGLPTSLPWGLPAPGSSMRVHPVSLYTAASAAALTSVLFVLLKTIRTPGRVAGIALAAAGTLAFALDTVRIPEQPLGHSLLDSSQWAALAAILLGGCLSALVPGVEVR